MRHVLSTLAAATLVASAFGCAHESPTASRLLVSNNAPITATAKSIVTAAAKPATKVATKAVAVPPTAEEAIAIAEVAAEDAAPAGPAVDGAPAAVADETVIEAPRFSIATGEGESSAESILDPWRPYGVGIVSKTHNSVTLAWRTDLKSKAIVYYGKSLGLQSRGYDGVAHDPNKATYHQITIGGLSRFRSYTFAVVGLGELTMQFPAYPIKTRTNLLF